MLLGLGILVRSFPGPGDVEVVELASGEPVHIGVDRLHKLQDGGWGGRGLSLVGGAKDAVATLVYQPPPLELTGVGLDMAGADPLTAELLPLGLEDLRRAIQRYGSEGSKDEKIHVLNIEYMSQNMTTEQAEHILLTPVPERRRLSAVDFLRAKAHLLGDEALRRKLTEPRVYMTTYGRDAEKKELSPGGLARIGHYGFVVKDMSRGGRKDARLVLYYDRIGVAQRGLKEHEAAKKTWDRVIKEAPRRGAARADAMFNLALLKLDFLEDTAGGKAELERYLQEAPPVTPSAR